ncbi:ATP-binding protein [Prevotella sp. AGR2160]|uniref:ATP-binding protein n=1 Tax=Prevotella sp. AGR2160 TaxID=1280674 RepID=UPI0004188EB9|nr:ATP-binding protein [Prevotella sp. AGR2160]
MFIREEYKKIKRRLEEPRKFIQVVMGPRQVGKSTVVKQVLKDISIPYLLFLADDVPATNRSWISDCWDQARVLLKAKGAGEVILVIDEIQKIQGWSEVVKKEWDMDSYDDVAVKVLLLGSSRVLLEKGLADSMAGRYEEIRMGHWSFTEMREAFGWTLEQYLFYGGYPGSALLIDEEDRWNDYILSSIVDATINKDILQNTVITKPAVLKQTFELASAYSGEIVSLTKMLGQLQDAKNTTTLSGYLNLLQQSGLVGGLQKYSIDMARKRASVPKYQVFNNALKTVFLNTDFHGAMMDRKLWGRVYESAIGSYLMNEAFRRRLSLYYWREGSDEVDFVLQKKGEIIAIEVKSNSEQDTHGLHVFQEKFHPKRSVIVGRAGIPAETFLSMDVEELF